MGVSEEKTRAMMKAYDDEAEAIGWFGPEIAFGLIYADIHSGESVLDIGIGTGLGSELFRKAGLTVFGMDLSPEMLAACRAKGFTNLEAHDLTRPPYPYASESMDHAICVGVLHFFDDLSTVFGEIARILRQGGRFVFIVGDRAEDEAAKIVVAAESGSSHENVTMYFHSPRQIGTYLEASGFACQRSLPFTFYMDREQIKCMRARAYLVRKDGGPDS